MAKAHLSGGKNFSARWLFMMIAFLIVGIMGAQQAAGAAETHGSGEHEFKAFNFWSDPVYSPLERFALILNVVVALAGLGYAWMLVKEVYGADTGTSRMKEIAQAVREGADAYLKRQLSTVGVLIVIITGVLVFTKWPSVEKTDPNYDGQLQIAIGRGIAFLFGAIFSATVGFVGMRLATAGNLRVAAAARESFGKAMQIGYRTITGMLTDGLGLLGGSLIFLYFGEKAYEALLGFGFGGTLLALFMRVGGGIYTKAADVGADLVGKVEKDIPEDDPRNAATIADNVGDNVGDCAGMAADIFESYEVTIVAAMILGYASFGHKGVIFPLLVRAIGVIGSIISTYSVKTGDKGDVDSAMKAVGRGFIIGSIISVVGFIILGFVYFRFTSDYGAESKTDLVALAFPLNDKEDRIPIKDKDVLKKLPGADGETDPKNPVIIQIDDEKMKVLEKDANSIRVFRGQERTEAKPHEAKKMISVVTNPAWDRIKEYEGENQPFFVNLGISGLDMRPSWTCLIGILLAIALHKCTEYWTGTEFEPVKSLAKSCRTGHATNIISGLALGYESAVWAVIIIATAILSSVLIYANTNPIFVAYGVAMCGIGLLTLTGNTISMDVFGPVADNANGIGEMGYNRDTNNQELKPTDPDYMTPEKYKTARQILADLDAVGNTTKAITKGIAIGSAVVAAVSLFASFIAVEATGSEEGINQLTKAKFQEGAAKLTVADPYVFIGLLIGGAVPFLFSSMTIRAVGRAAYLIVQECRIQFRDKEIWAGTKKPDYGRVVDICTSTAQKELIGPGLLAMFAPILVGFAMGPTALGGFLAGMILSGQLIAVFMANAGGAWDNAKKTIEDQPKVFGQTDPNDPNSRVQLTGKGSEAHKASVTGDTVGDPLKDTAGPAINPLIKVMNMVSLLILPSVLAYSVVVPEHKTTTLVVSIDEKTKNVKVADPDTFAANALIEIGNEKMRVAEVKDDGYIVDRAEDKTNASFHVKGKEVVLARKSDALMIGLVVLAISFLAVAWAWWQSKRESVEMKKMDEEFEQAVIAAGGSLHPKHEQH
jgi:K(+)-stimulated pyrophosphate-energized sodium pump